VSKSVSYNNDVNNFVELRIRRKHTRALVDTGAYYNCLNLSFANRIKLRYFPISPDKPETLVSANDGKLKVHGMTTVCVSIVYVCDVDFLVVDDLNVNCILGLSILKANQADVKLSDSTLTLQNGLTAVPLITRFSKSNILRTRHAITVEPLCEILFPVRIHNTYKLQPSIVEQLPGRLK